jgi:sodium-dependent dicarboxylate transporter 2/3/5
LELRSFLANRRLLGLFLGAALFILTVSFLSLPDLPVKAKNMLAVALLMAVWWMSEAVPLAVTALVPLVLFPLLGISSTANVAPNYTNHLVFLFLGGFLIAAALVRWKLHRRLALFTINVIGVSPPMLILGFMVASAFLSMWISNTATALMLLPIGMAVVNRLAKSSSSAKENVTTLFGQALMLGIAYGASIGGLGTLIGTPPNGVFVGQLMRTYAGNAPEISFFQWMLVGVPVVLVMLPLAWLIILWTSGKGIKELKFGVKGRAVIREEMQKLGAMSSEEIRVGVVFALTAFLWIFRKPVNLGFVEIPGWSQLLEFGNQISDATVAMAMGLLLFIIPVGKKAREGCNWKEGFLLNWQSAREAVPWSILLLFGGGFALAQGFMTSGLSDYLGSRIEFLQGAPVILVILTVCFLMTFLTEMTSNTATTTLVLPILAVAALDFGQHPFLLMIPATLSASCAFMLPVATPPNAIVFGSGWVTIPRMSRTGIFLNFLGILIITAATLFLVTSVFGIEEGVMPSWSQGAGNINN